MPYVPCPSVKGVGTQTLLETEHRLVLDSGTSWNWLDPDPPGKEGAAEVPSLAPCSYLADGGGR